MEIPEKDKSAVEKTGEDLFNFAIDREDVKYLTANHPGGSQAKRHTVEYELQILKIITVGWAISFFLDNFVQKDQLSEIYWKGIQEYSHSISTTTELFIGHDINYFQILKDRLNTYVQEMEKYPQAPEPAVVIGPEFARACGAIDDVYAVMAGSRMFKTTITSIREYLHHKKCAFN